MKVSDIDWEIKQVWLAIDYYEQAIKNSFFKKEVESYEKTISKLNQQVKTLEKKRDERGCAY
tara:strand:+ start:1506 stop:1691 length:186 start_codon:yes stop_codon:yes gene_type:complete